MHKIRFAGSAPFFAALAALTISACATPAPGPITWTTPVPRAGGQDGAARVGTCVWGAVSPADREAMVSAAIASRQQLMQRVGGWLAAHAGVPAACASTPMHGDDLQLLANTAVSRQALILALDRRAGLTPRRMDAALAAHPDLQAAMGIMVRRSFDRRPQDTAPDLTPVARDLGADQPAVREALNNYYAYDLTYRVLLEAARGGRRLIQPAG